MCVCVCVCVCMLLLFSSQVMSTLCDPHGLQYARLPCLLLSPRICPSSCPLNRWYHPNNFILCCPLLLLPSIFLSIRVLSNELAVHIGWPKYCICTRNQKQWNILDGREQLMMTAGSGHKMTRTTGEKTAKTT